jgi:hypothetical protein
MSSSGNSRATRLGEGTVDVEVHGLISPFDGAPIRRMPVPGRWLRGVTKDVPARCEEGRIIIEDVAMVYSIEGLTLVR